MKIILMLCIFVSGLCGIVTPRCFDPFGDNISYANLVSCGVIMAAALVHLLPDASKGAISASYPWSYVIFGASFIGLFSFERILIHTLLHRQHHHPADVPMERTSLTHHTHTSITTDTACAAETETNAKCQVPVEHNHGQQAHHALHTYELMQQKNYIVYYHLFVYHSTTLSLCVFCFVNYKLNLQNCSQSMVSNYALL